MGNFHRQETFLREMNKQYMLCQLRSRTIAFKQAEYLNKHIISYNHVYIFWHWATDHWKVVLSWLRRAD